MWSSEQKMSSIIIYRAFSARHIPEEVEKIMVNDFLKDPRDREALLLANSSSRDMHLQQHLTDRIAIMELMNPPFNLNQSELFTKTVLNLENRKIDDARFLVFAKAVSRGALTALEKLYLHRNQIGDAGITAFALALESGALPKLESLVLSYNSIGDVGVTALATALATAVRSGALASLKKLFMDDNKIGDAGISALASACASGALDKLEDLSLYDNKIGDQGMISLSDTLGKGDLPKLEVLGIDLRIDSSSAKLQSACEARRIDV